MPFSSRSRRKYSTFSARDNGSSLAVTDQPTFTQMVAAVQKKKPARSRTPATSLRISFLLRSKCHANAAHHAAITEKRTRTANIAVSVNATGSATGKADDRAFGVIPSSSRESPLSAELCAPIRDQ